MPNKRIIYSVKQVGFAKLGSTSYTPAHGVQSVGINTNFNLEQVFELGQIAIYENIENIPDVEVTIEKVIDGYPLIYHLATNGAASATLSGRQNVRSIVGLSIFADTKDSATGTPETKVAMSGMYVSALTYTIPVEGNCSESVTLVGNHKRWYGGADNSFITFNGAFTTNNDSPLSSASGTGGVQRRENVLFNCSYHILDSNNQIADSGTTILPREIDGISSSGTNNRDSEGNYSAHLQTITISTDLGREELFELGHRSPYHRFVTFPTEVTCAIEVTASSGDMVSATDEGIYGNNQNLRDNTIRVVLQEGLKLDLGTKNKLASVTYGGGDATGGNDTVTYNYSNFNVLTVAHPQDPSGLPLV